MAKRGRKPKVSSLQQQQQDGDDVVVPPSCEDTTTTTDETVAAAGNIDNIDDGGGVVTKKQQDEEEEEVVVATNSSNDDTVATTEEEEEESNDDDDDDVIDVDEEPTAATTQTTPTDSAEEEEEEEKGDAVDSVWDLIRLADGTELCRTDGCTTKAVSVWGENVAPDDVWPMCEECQLKDFGGWPVAFEVPTNLTTNTTSTLEAGELTTTTTTTTSNGSDDVGHPQEEEEEEAEHWDLIKILSISDVTGQPIKCSSEHCQLPACCVYRSNKDPTKWYGCLDCQDNEFGGWPPAEELPKPTNTNNNDYMSKLHIETLARKCSTKSNITMPDPMVTSPNTGSNNANDNTNTVITPLPGGAIQNGGGRNGVAAAAQPSITPSPSAVAAQQKKGAAKKQAGTQPSKQALAMHEKWRKQAQDMGGKGATIVVNKPEAKKLIFDLLYEAFRPKNITQIHKELKATVPNPVLKGCLDDMVPDNDNGDFDDSDDEDSSGKKNKGKNKTTSETKDTYDESLSFKGGKTTNTSLYFVNHNKQKNNGNGLEPHARNELFSNMAMSQAEEEALKASHNQMTAQTKKLLSEPTNENLGPLLAQKESELEDLNTQAEAAREHKVNEKVKLQTKSRVENMAAQWRRRKRTCQEFLVNMEEMTDGTVSSKKCLAGDGQIEIDSDEAVAKAVVAFAKKKKLGGVSFGSKKRKAVRDGGVKKTGTASESTVMASEDFVAVVLDSQGNVERVSADEQGA